MKAGPGLRKRKHIWIGLKFDDFGDMVVQLDIDEGSSDLHFRNCPFNNRGCSTEAGVMPQHNIPSSDACIEQMRDQGATTEAKCMRGTQCKIFRIVMKDRKERSTLSGVNTGASVPRSSPRLLL